MVATGKKWQARMEKAAITAEQAGRTELATLLRKELVGYRDPVARVTAGLVYGEICDVVVENPELTFYQVIDPCLAGTTASHARSS